ncbi:MAG: DUF11 domain-containing protein [Pseudomonadota bacterium]
MASRFYLLQSYGERRNEGARMDQTMKLKPVLPVLSLVSALFLGVAPSTANAEGTIAGTDISNTASVTFDVEGTTLTQSSNTVTITVDETLDVAVVLQSPQIAVAPADTDRVLVFTVTNTGNGVEDYTLTVDNTDATDDFDPVAATPSIYFDSDNSGDLSPGDEPYVPGTNDPSLNPDETITVLVANDIPAGLNNGDIGRSSLVATANTGSGAPGTVIAGAGTNSVDAVVGSSGATASVAGEYVVSDVAIDFQKSATILDPFGGDQPVPGATITYRITLEVTGTGTATGLVVTDPIPANTTFVAGSITLNGIGLSDQDDGDAGRYNDAATPAEVIVVVGDIAAADGLQAVEFAVLID